MARGGFMVWHGLDEFRAQLRQVPATCRNEAARIVEGGVNSAFVQISTVYGRHRYTGTLQNRLTIAPLRVRGEFTTGLVLKSGSPLAWLFDNGSQARHWKTGSKKSTGKMWGRTPPTHIFLKTVIKTRREITDRVHGMVHRQLTELGRTA